MLHGGTNNLPRGDGLEPQELCSNDKNTPAGPTLGVIFQIYLPENLERVSDRASVELSCELANRQCCNH